MIVPAAAPVIIPECRHTGVAVPRARGAPRPIGWLPPLTPGLLAKPQPLPLPSFPPLAPPRGARLPMPARRAPESPCVHTWDPHSPHLEQRSSHGNDNTRQFPVCGHQQRSDRDAGPCTHPRQSIQTTVSPHSVEQILNLVIQGMAQCHPPSPDLGHTLDDEVE